MKKIFFLIPTMSVGGGERVVSELSLEFTKKMDVTIVVFKKEISYTYGGNLISLDVPLSTNFFLKIYYYNVARRKFKKLVEEQKPDYVISFGHIANIVNILSGAKAIVRADNFLSKSLYGFGGGIYKFLINRFFKRAYYVVAVSAVSSYDLSKNFNINKEKVGVFYNPLNISEIEKLSREALPEKYRDIFSHPVIINVGRLNKQKGQKYLLEAFKEVKKSIQDVKLVILGVGELEDDLKKQAEDLEIANDVYFLGWQKNPFMFLAHAKVFALSSLWEGMPYVILEAMACGLPVVSFDCESGPREIMASSAIDVIGADHVIHKTQDIEWADYGVLCNSDSSKLAKAVIDLMRNPEKMKKYSEASRKRVRGFNTEERAKQWDLILK